LCPFPDPGQASVPVVVDDTNLDDDEEEPPRKQQYYMYKHWLNARMSASEFDEEGYYFIHFKFFKHTFTKFLSVEFFSEK